jgi:hypothetical protein
LKRRAVAQECQPIKGKTLSPPYEIGIVNRRDVEEISVDKPKKHGLGPLEIGILCLAILIAGVLLTILASYLFAPVRSAPANSESALRPTSGLRSLPPTWTPYATDIPPTRTPTPVPSITPSPIIPTESIFLGYEPVEMNDQNYPAVDPIRFYSHPEDYYQRRFQIEGYVVTFGYISIAGEDEYVIQIGVDLNEPRGQIVARAPILALNFAPDTNLMINQKIVLYGSGGNTVSGTNVLGGEQESPLVFGEWYQTYTYQSNGGSSIPPGCYNCP